jgi:lysine 2,3-aminomutase
MNITWQEELKTAYRNVEELSNVLDVTIAKNNYPLFIPKNFLEKIKSKGPRSAIYKQFIPSTEENKGPGMLDPIGDQKFQVTKNLIHRYHNRALFLPTTFCPVICRYCFRKNELYDQNVFKADLESSLTYLKNHPEIEEIIFTGGDPFILADSKLLEYAQEFSKIKSIKFLRFHTRTPIVLPSRMTPELISILNEMRSLFSQVSIMIHTNHGEELDDEVKESLLMLKKTNCLLFSQTVLLKDINDHEQTLSDLFHTLGNLGIIPYYLHHPDQALGTKHFQLELERGRMIYSKLRNMLPGWLIPQYIFDIPGGGGKVQAFNPERFNFDGKMINIHGEQVEI